MDLTEASGALDVLRIEDQQRSSIGSGSHMAAAAKLAKMSPVIPSSLSQTNPNNASMKKKERV